MRNEGGGRDEGMRCKSARGGEPFKHESDKKEGGGGGKMLEIGVGIGGGPRGLLRPGIGITEGNGKHSGWDLGLEEHQD